ncbi:hypothetical protein AB6F89_22040 [Providencia hangzhouensis]|uniref:hypothetical protein n=1 Tax=Providencia hangzhouensis TaxID=3031799 RepID=UPI001D6DFB3E|nr:hypothetical protein [Providencia rettgeri]EIJ7168006.1 hypothetical protein [Providencia rettgeri]EMA4783751.1 hypothetical protein [Providencia rettgeri]
MSDKRNSRVGRDINRQKSHIAGIYFYLGYFFVVAALLTLFIFDDMLVSAMEKPENTIWLNAEVQSQFKFVFGGLANLFLVLSLSSLSVPLFLFIDSRIDKIKQRIKKTSA